ncbi:SDR family NAD(P)-dependent oxidoreductase [Pasteurellaceae bacterium USgator11]|nr:SDR family NAD(P)-dependent oxidoreductase [Pasteurellaceae bacterium UScroc12]TNG97054.1 SDR family NAD(P)-dependent oxidoreductase [Pasteurellaceae bacterium UScroc31]TNG97403.1 SDR family NAD(P)-dependent oxidoreductase [Pasteurellaceae bacterium USgator41]TNH00715.1 SDR family NAD(P)-dependent oxidoreductase [Pasteurellaceae bacterium USgator11]
MKKTILITGCSSGIGYATALYLQQHDWQVIASCRKTEDVARLQQEGLECVQLDITDLQQIQQVIQQISANRTLDAIFCNAGYGQTGAVEDISHSALQQQFATNVFGTWDCIRYAMAVFRQQSHGRIIVNSSILGFAAMPWRGAYNSSKFALEGLCDTLRTELRGSRIFVSLLQPGPIRSRFRPNALAKFEQHIDWQNSVHRNAYQQQLQRLNASGNANPFTLPAEACAKAVLRCLESNSPKPRYRVTFPTKLYWWLRRLLPTRAFDWMNWKGGNQ